MPDNSPLASKSTLRDSFALVGMSLGVTLALTDGEKPQPHKIAADAYALADAMLAARNGDPNASH
jgi:hypothetical protein